MNNLDALCARSAGPISNDKSLEALIRNSLGVLREEGIFALYIFLSSKGEKGEVILKCVEGLLQKQEAGQIKVNNGQRRERFIKITEDLPKLLLARQLIERTLTYALYGLKGK